MFQVVDLERRLQQRNVEIQMLETEVSFSAGNGKDCRTLTQKLYFFIRR